MRIHHLALRTAQLQPLFDFYAGVLGLEVRAQDERRVWLVAGDALLMLEKRNDDEPGVAIGTRELLAFAVTEAERESWVTRLAAAGIALEDRTAHTLYFRDPDGRRVGVSSYPFDP